METNRPVRLALIGAAVAGLLAASPHSAPASIPTSQLGGIYSGSATSNTLSRTYSIVLQIFPEARGRKANMRINFLTPSGPYGHAEFVASLSGKGTFNAKGKGVFPGPDQVAAKLTGKFISGTPNRYEGTYKLPTLGDSGTFTCQFLTGV